MFVHVIYGTPLRASHVTSGHRPSICPLVGCTVQLAERLFVFNFRCCWGPSLPAVKLSEFGEYERSPILPESLSLFRIFRILHAGDVSTVVGVVCKLSHLD